MLLNPFAEPDTKATYAKASRKTDMYAFAVLTWEVLSQKKPFSDIRSEPELGVAVHRNIRPPVNDLPTETPPGIIRMIDACWSTDRSERKSASECYSIVFHHQQIFTLTNFDIFFSHAWKNKPFLSHVYSELVKLGYKVWYDQNDMGHNLEQSMKDGIDSSKVVLVCANSLYQERQNCMYELREAHKKGKSIVTLAIEKNPFAWANEELKLLCDLQKTMFVDIGEVAEMNWDSENGVSEDMKAKLKNSLTFLLKELHSVGCMPTLL
jgi:serine/threonine protein kinase